MTIKVIKRDGRSKDFDSNRIVTAINMTIKDVDIEDNSLGVEVAKRVTKYIEDNNVTEITVEEIQDLVVNNLKELNKDVAKSYQDYREKREIERKKRSEEDKFAKEVLMCSNVDNDNSNVDQYSFSGRKKRIADEGAKAYAKRHMLSKEGKKAFEEGLIYYHDFSEYETGNFNCMNLKIENGLEHGFKTRNGDVRGANSFSTACQLVAVMFQCQSQCQFGGVGASALDFQMEKSVKQSFRKHYIDGLVWLEGLSIKESKKKIGKKLLSIENKKDKNISEKAYRYANEMLDREGNQSTQGLFHNLNTLESRAGSQLPFTSLNLGRNTSPEGRKICEWIFNASLDGIGQNHRTSIFPISIFQYKKGVNAHKGDPNYDIKKMAINSLCHRIYPNFVNGDYKQVVENPNDYNTFFATMG